MNLLCALFGHQGKEVASAVTICERCNSIDDYYGRGAQWTPFEWQGIVGTAREWWWLCRRRLPALRSKCSHCERRFWRLSWKRYDVDFCCEQHAKDWCPF